MITITNASIYSTKGEMAYQVIYSDGTEVRVVQSRDQWLRKEYKQNGEWKPAGKPYIIQANNKRQAERLMEEVKRIVKEM